MEKVLIPGLDRFQEWDIYKINPGYIIIIISNKMLKHTHTHTHTHSVMEICQRDTDIN